MAVFSAIAAGVGLAMSAGSAIKGASDAKKAKRAINNYQRQELSNPYGNLQVSTLGAELQQESMDRRSATAIKALQGMGGRGVLGGLAGLEAQQQEGERQIAADLDAQAKRVAELRAQGEYQKMGMQETREQQDLAGLGAQLSAGQQSMWNGISSFGSIASSMVGTGRPQVQNIKTTTAGIKFP